MVVNLPFENKDNLLCEHGCGQIAKYRNLSGKLCCSETFYQCPGYKKRQSDDSRNRPPSIPKGTYLKDKSGICQICGKPHNGRYGSGRYCSSECARKAGILHTDKSATYKKVSQTLKLRSNDQIYQSALKGALTYNKNHPDKPIELPVKNHLYKITKYRYNGKNIIKKCKICGQLVCPNKDKCKRMLKLNFKYFTNIIDTNKLGTVDIYKEYDKLGKWLYDQYINKCKSALDIQKELGIKNFVTVYFLLQKFKIKKRNYSQASTNSMLQKPKSFLHFHNTNIYHCGYHTSWEGKTFWYRSSYELDYAKELDKKKIRYEVESIRMTYQRSIENRTGIMITDFYLPDSNTIVEVKSDFTYNEQDWKDRVSVLSSKGYKCMLLLEHKWFDCDHIPKQRMNHMIDNYYDK